MNTALSAPQAFSSVAHSADGFSALSEQQQRTFANSRRRRDTTGDINSPVPVAIADKDVGKAYLQLVSDVKNGPDASAFSKGYNSPSKVALPGYFESMSDLQLMRLGLQATPEQLGALHQLAEKRDIQHIQDQIKLFTSVMTEKGTKVTPMPQSYYLSITNRLSEGECAAVSHLLALSIAEGKQHVFLGNIYHALANPDAPESKAFFNKLTEIQRYIQNPVIAMNPATTRLVAHTSIAAQLISSPTSTTLLIGSDGHRMMASVVVDPSGNRTYYFGEPNFGLVEFSTPKNLIDGMDKYFTLAESKGYLEPAQKGGHLQPSKYAVSVFEPDHVPPVSPSHSGVRFMYDAPLGDLQTLKIIDASRLSTAAEFRAQTSVPYGAPKADYDKVSEGLEKLHASKGMEQYHQTKAVLSAIEHFTATYPNAPQVTSVKALEQKLANLIQGAAAPVDYPFIFEQMESDRAALVENKIEPKLYKILNTKNARAEIIAYDGCPSTRLKQVADNLGAALDNIYQHDPQMGKSMPAEFPIVIPAPGVQAQTQLRLGTPPTLIIGDDYFVAPSTGNPTVADRVGQQAQANGTDPITQKQVALITGKLGMLGHYRANPQAFLRISNRTDPFRENGHQLSARAGRSARDFLVEAFTTKLYDGKLDSRVEATFNKLFLPDQNASKSAAVQTSKSVAVIDPVQVERLGALDVSHGRIRIGESEISRAALYKMGATVDGKPIDSVQLDDPTGVKLSSKITLDIELFKAYLKSNPSDVLEHANTVIAEIGVNRSNDHGPLFKSVNGVPVPEQLETTLRDLREQHALIKTLEQGKKPLPADFFSAKTSTKGGVTQSAGLGFQAFSTFQALRSSLDSLRNGDTTAGVIGLGALTAEYAGMGVEAGLNKVAKSVATRSAPSILGFKSSSVGKAIGKVGGGVGAFISVPFDIYNAVDSFKKAASSTGKDAQDHYVNGSFAVTNAVTSITLGSAFLAGASAAGPVGLAVAGVLMASQAIYSAVRTVEDIDQYTPLTAKQKFTVGFASFLGLQPGFDVIRPYLEAKHGAQYIEQNMARYSKFLEGPGKNYFERVVFGSADVRVQGKVENVDPPFWMRMMSVGGIFDITGVPGIVPYVAVKDGNDHISGHFKAWNNKVVNVVQGQQGPDKATLWDLGGGDDWVTGIKNKPNYFLLGDGKKKINGGDQDDTFILNANAHQTLQQAQQVAKTEKGGFSKHQTSLDGGGGRNTLKFSGALRTPYKEDTRDRVAHYAGHVIDFTTNTVSVKTEASNTQGVKKIAHIQSFSDVITVEKGESLVRGDHRNNKFTLNGDKDVAFTGKGSNVIVINGGAHVTGEGGTNTYVINKNYMQVTLDDPASSVVRLDYSAAQVSGWAVSPSGDLTVTLSGDTHSDKRALLIKKAFTSDNPDNEQALQTFITNDGVMMTVSAAKADGSGIRTPRVSSMKVVPDTPGT